MFTPIGTLSGTVGTQGYMKPCFYTPIGSPYDSYSQRSVIFFAMGGGGGTRGLSYMFLKLANNIVTEAFPLNDDFNLNE